MRSHSASCYRNRDATIRLARDLRAHPTDAEQRLWYFLRNRRLGGLKFRRQHPCGPYFADFLCEEQRLIVEVDGGQHALQSEADSERTRHLELLGYRVLRFWNNEVLRNMQGVAEAILREAGKL